MAAASLISALLDQVFSITTQQATHKLKLVTGVDEAVCNLTSNLHAIRYVLEDAEKRQVNESAVKIWIAELKDVSYDIDDVLDEWNTELLKQQIEQQGTSNDEDIVPPPKKVRFSFLSSVLPFHQVVRCEISVKIEEVDKKLAIIANQRRRYNFTSEKSSHDHHIRNITTSVIDESEVFVREEDKKTIKEMLLLSNEETPNLRIISMVGMGGIGKTTLSQLAYNDIEVKSHFEKRIWVCVSDLFDEARISKEILESLLGEKPDLDGMNSIQEKIRDVVSGRKILLVLDDVWTEDSNKWNQLKASLSCSCPGSRVLVTTRKKEVGMAMGCKSTTDMFFLRELSDDKSWSLFSRLAFFDRTPAELGRLEDLLLLLKPYNP